VTCVEEQLIEHSPAVHVRRPKISQESTRLGLDRAEPGALLVQAGLSGGNDHALACLLALNALRVSEACSAELSDLALANGHRVVRIVGKGNRPRSSRSRHGPLERLTLRSVNAPTARCSHARMAPASTGTPRDGSCGGSRSVPGSTSPSRPLATARSHHGRARCRLQPARRLGLRTAR
jgi:integrase